MSSRIQKIFDALETMETSPPSPTSPETTEIMQGNEEADIVKAIENAEVIFVDEQEILETVHKYTNFVEHAVNCGDDDTNEFAQTIHDPIGLEIFDNVGDSIERVNLEENINILKESNTANAVATTMPNTNDLDWKPRLTDEAAKRKRSDNIPKKDLCDACVAFETGNLSEKKYNRHQEMKRESRDEKSKDK
ncbi:hypothetical protein ILUMI_24875, partial [Ignelater luminosus]